MKGRCCREDVIAFVYILGNKSHINKGVLEYVGQVDVPVEVGKVPKMSLWSAKQRQCEMVVVLCVKDTVMLFLTLEKRSQVCWEKSVKYAGKENHDDNDVFLYTVLSCS